MEAVDLTSQFSFGDSSLGDGGNEVKICKAATRGTSMITRSVDVRHRVCFTFFYPRARSPAPCCRR
jgi:hypothetical protein